MRMSVNPRRGRLAAAFLCLVLMAATAPTAQAATFEVTRWTETVAVDQDCGTFTVPGELVGRISQETHPDGMVTTRYRWDGVVTRSDTGRQFQLHHRLAETFDPSDEALGGIATLTFEGPALYGLFDADGNLLLRDWGKVVIDVATGAVLFAQGEFPMGPPPPPCWVYDL